MLQKLRLLTANTVSGPCGYGFITLTKHRVNLRIQPPLAIKTQMSEKVFYCYNKAYLQILVDG
jgi:hypothetical protein